MIYRTKENIKKAVEKLINEKHYDYYEAQDIAENIFNQIKYYRNRGGMPENRINFEYFFSAVLSKEEFEKEYNQTWALQLEGELKK